MKQLLIRGLLALCAVATLPATSVNGWTFNGTCLDCPSTGQATLLVTPSGNTLNFELTYVSDWLSYTMNNATLWVNSGNGYQQFSGNSFTIGPSDELYFVQQGISVTSTGGLNNPLPAGTATRDFFFRTWTNGDWMTGDVGQNSDFGNGGVWTAGVNTAVPEPSTWGLAGVSVAALLVRRARQQRA